MAFGNFIVEAGKALPAGATVTDRGVNFSVFSRHAKSITVVVFESTAADSRYVQLELDIHKNKTGDMWHCHIPGLKAGSLYL
ncbi:MAG: glycogen debranching enzyme, partial [Treponema sp.]|nr:glycogen debranching enzyme [Treponema sp.]